MTYYINHNPYIKNDDKGRRGQKIFNFKTFMKRRLWTAPSWNKAHLGQLGSLLLRGQWPNRPFKNSCSDIANRNRRKALSKFLKTEKELFESYPTQRIFFLENNCSMQFGSTTKNNLFKRKNSRI